MRLGLLAIALQMDFVREAQALGQNHGQRVNGIQIWSGGSAALNTSWCAWWATMVLDLYFKGASPVPRQGAAQGIRDLCTAKGWTVQDPQPSDLFFFVDAADRAHHVGFVTIADPLTGIAGNTSSDGASSNGDGVYEHALRVPRPQVRFARVPGVNP